MKEIDPVVAALADKLWRSPEVPPALPGQEDTLVQALKLNRQRSTPSTYQPPGMMLGPSWLGLDFPLAEAISPMGAHMVQGLLGGSGTGDDGLAQFMPGAGDAIDAWSALRYAGDAVHSGLLGDWNDMGQNASWAAVAAMGALPGLDAPSTQGIRAYHGSPYDFDKFDINKIGTGEGAQAYGHGLYFAENEGVARSYRDALGGSKSQLDAINARLSELARIMEKDAVPGAYRKFRSDVGATAAKEYDDLLLKRSNLGHMYEVNINANPDDFLDWDKPLSEQSEKVREALKQWGIDTEKWSHKTGGDVVQYGLGGHGSRAEMPGIPGIKYLDQGSRRSGAGTRNYVVFDDKLIDIVRKYGIAGLLALPALGAFSGDSEASQ